LICLSQNIATNILNRIIFAEIRFNLINNTKTAVWTLIESNGVVEFCVEDDGIGMSESQVGEILMDVGFAEAMHSQGTGGLGLQLVKEFIRLHGSQLKITSNSGEGSRFCFSLTLI